MFSQSLENVRMSPIVTISEEVRKRSKEFKERTGKDFLLFQRGEVDFATPQYIKDAATKGLELGLTKYPKSGGEAFFKEAVVKKLEYYNNVKGLTPDNVIATYGGQEGLELTFKLFEGKKGAGFAPCWSCVLENFVPYCNIDFMEVPLEPDFTVNYEKLEDMMKGISFFYLNNPQNPSGKLFNEEEIVRITGLCEKYGVYLITDESYESIVYDGDKVFSALSLPYKNIISIYTLSKTYSMTGWRIGYLATRNEAIPRLMLLGNYTQTAGVTTFIQFAAAEALNNRTESEKAISEMVNEYKIRRDALYEILKGIPGLKVYMPHAGFYFFPDFSGLIPGGLGEEEQKLYAYQKMMDAGIATVYGACFGHHFNNNVRFSYSATNLSVIKEAGERLKILFN
ncbi:MAG: aminotransferase class I/II-fold pyridoxal phosphate-dependent enzyme [Ignavibacteriaceae bacterium]|nr:aminotransferase class I/II-fold pyridoxal phosphate-dependent enzyme [Ignavibacteriaceae bacterium]